MDHASALTAPPESSPGRQAVRLMGRDHSFQMSSGEDHGREVAEVSVRLWPLLSLQKKILFKPVVP